MNGPLVLGIDCSTTAVKAIAWDMQGQAHAEGRAPIGLQNPGPDAWEQDPLSWWEATKTAIRGAVLELGAEGARRIQALCVANQRETFCATDEEGEPLHPALVWMDARCRKQVERISAEFGSLRLHEISGKYPCTTPSMYKLLFLMEELSPALRSKPIRVLDVHAFVVKRLTGRTITSAASADPMGFLDMKARDWSDKLLLLSGLSRANMPALAEPGERIGQILPHVAEELGLSAETVVVAGAGDGQAAALGAGLTGPDEAYLNLGTAIVSGVHSPDYRIDAAFRTMIQAGPRGYLLETDLKGGTFTLTWLSQKLLGCSESESNAKLKQLEEKAEGLKPGSDGLILVPYWNGVMNPYWDDGATGMMMGLHGGHGPEHIYRAILEGIAMEQRLHTEGVEAAMGRGIETLVVMGGGSRSDLFCRIAADVLGKRVERSGTAEATALGAGILGAWGSGKWAGSFEDAVLAMSSRGVRFEPGAAGEMYDRLYREVYVGLYPAMKGAMGRLLTLRQDAASRL